MYAGHSPYSIRPWTLRILAANAIVHLLSITVLASTDLLRPFAFVPALALQQPWTAVTYQFLHAGFMHLAFNMLMLFVFGSAVEERMGSRFPLYYLFCGIGGAAMSFVFAYNAPVIGASGAVLGVALAYAFYWPNREIMIFPLPVPIKVKWLVAFLAVLALFGATSPNPGTVAHFAHLGGLLAGAIYLFGTREKNGAAAYRPPARPEVLVHPTAHGEKKTHRVNRWKDEAMYREVDRVLDKISESGIESLTDEERRILDESSRQMNRH